MKTEWISAPVAQPPAYTGVLVLALLAAAVLAAPVDVVVPPFEGADAGLAQLQALERGFLGALQSDGTVRAMAPAAPCPTRPDAGAPEAEAPGCLSAPCQQAPAACAARSGGRGVVLVTVTAGEPGQTARVQLFTPDSNAPHLDASATFTDGQRLATWLDQEAASVRHNLEPALQVGAPARGARGFHLVRWIPAMVGTGCLLAGAVTYGVSRGRAAELKAVARSEEVLPAADIDALASRGRLEQSVGLGLVVWGLSSIALSVVWQALTHTALE